MQTENEIEVNRDIKVEEFDKLVDDLWEARTIYDREKAILSDLYNTYQETERIVLAHMQALEKDQYRLAGRGLISVKNSFSVSVPKDPDKKLEFFNYLKETEQFDGLATVHSATLNSWWKEEFEKAKKEGNSDFAIPGLDEPKLQTSLAMRKG